jgi:putative tryptophan/tyrosine transport system substrate-binding protein
MRRREFIVSVGAAAAWPLAARAQTSVLPVIGFLSVRSARDSIVIVAAFGKGLEEAGFAEGRNLSTEYRFAETQARIALAPPACLTPCASPLPSAGRAR